MMVFFLSPRSVNYVESAFYLFRHFFTVHCHVLDMSKSMIRTPTNEIEALIEFYSVFRPCERQFLMELNHRWSVYDTNRNHNMAVIVRQTFASEHTMADIAGAIEYFHSLSPRQLFAPITVNTALAQSNQSFHLNPYDSKCPVCLSMLLPQMADIKRIRIYTLCGRIEQGIV